MTNRRAMLATTALTPARAFASGMQTTPEAVQAARQNYAGGGSNTDEMLKRSPDSAAMLEYWDLTDNLVDGIIAMRLAGEKYLPKFTDEDENDYKYRLGATKLTNIYRDTVESLAQKPFEQEVHLVVDENKTIPTPLLDFIENVDGSGSNLTMFAAATFFNGINSAIDWVFVDFSKPDPSIRSVADAKAAGIRPYWSHVLGRNVLNPKSEMINGSETLTYIKIYEPGAPDHVREFIRSLDGVVSWKLYEKGKVQLPMGDGHTQFFEVDSGTVSIGVIPLVPFYTGRRDGRGYRFFPAMRDAADLQVELYQQESALKFAKILAAYPMLAGNGVRPPLEPDGKTVKKIAVGPNRVLYAPPDVSGGRVANWAYVEPAATSLKFLADDIKETISQLRELGRQPLTAQSGNLTVITTAIAAGKAKSAVSAWALGLKNALENAFTITCLWLNIAKPEYDPVMFVYTDFDEFADGKDLDTLNTMRGAGDISRETYWAELQRRKVLGPDFNSETEEQRLLDEVPGIGEDTTDVPGVPPVNKPKPKVPA